MNKPICVWHVTQDCEGRIVGSDQQWPFSRLDCRERQLICPMHVDDIGLRVFQLPFQRSTLVPEEVASAVPVPVGNESDIEVLAAYPNRRAGPE
jgi:hypothetical protein